jgi:predicted PurR-regulated permease PerM
MSNISPPPRIRLASWLLMGLALPLVLLLHLLPSLLAGLLVFELVHVGAPLLERRLSSVRAKQAAVILLAALVIGLMTLVSVLTVGFFRSDAGSLAALAQKMAEILENSRRSLPPWLVDMLPGSVDALKQVLTTWLRSHGAEVQLLGKDAVIIAARILIGMVVGGLVALHEACPTTGTKPLAAALTARLRTLAHAFRRIVFAQVRISLLNTLFTGLYLGAVLPLSGVHLPFTKTMILLTFVLGLLPVVGNLMSNGIIVVVSSAHSPQMALASLAFLVLIHKLEYFLNARIVGSQIAAHAWELLVAMLAMEAAFGLPGIVAAPIFYAYLKRELSDAGLV